MRWDRLFDDLEARFAELSDAEAAAEQPDRDRVAIGGIRMTQRLVGSKGRRVRVMLGGTVVAGVLRTVGPDWLLLSENQGRDCIVALSAVAAVDGLTAATGTELTPVAMRLDLRRALRGLARDRAPIALVLVGWTGGFGGGIGAVGSDGPGEITGTIDRVGADYVELAVHAAWEPRRAAAVRSVVLVPLSAILLVRALPLG